MRFHENPCGKNNIYPCGLTGEGYDKASDRFL